LEVDVQQGNFKILQLLLQILILFLVEKWNPPTRSETAKIGPKNKRNFRGLNLIGLILVSDCGLWSLFSFFSPSGVSSAMCDG
jgi:hypothetical protein